MGLDLEMCVVSRQFENILLKWRSDTEYAEWLSFTQSILWKEDFQTFNDPILEQFRQDIVALKSFYEYSEDDFFFEKGRESATLDYIFNGFIDEFDFDLPHNILWEGGDRLENLTSVQGVTLRIYRQSHIENINSFLYTLFEDDILKKYDYDAMSKAGVYKLTDPNYKFILTESFFNLQSLFHRAFTNDVYILRNIY